MWKIEETKELADNCWMVRGELTLIEEGTGVAGISTSTTVVAANIAALENAFAIAYDHEM